ncbi:MAG TPA: hypothetical protein VMT30_05760 [Candidatus Saccharimonadia bacterium]|nr:hypothetical protein [Candidatus Saccharimonadia bacterium]
MSRFKLSASTTAALAIVSVTLSVVAASLPGLFGTSVGQSGSLQPPPLGLLLGFGLAVTAGVGLIMAVAMRAGLNLPRATWYTVLGFNVAIIVVKFVLAPLGLYTSNAANPFVENGFGPVINNDTSGFLWAAAASGILYVLVFSLIAIFNTSTTPSNRAKRFSAGFKWLVALSLVAIFALIGWQYLVLPLVMVAGPLFDYIGKLGPYALLITLVLLVAGSLAALSFRSLGRNAPSPLARGATLAAVFWLCLSLILMYHVVWVIFMSALVTIWPFKTFLPSGSK